MKACIRLFSILSLLCSFALPGLAQTSFTSLRGTVTDATGAVVPNAEVKLTNKATDVADTRTTDEHGFYQFVQLRPGSYVIATTASGFQQMTKEADLLVNQPATINFSLGVGAATEIVNVSAEAQTLNTTDASLGSAMNNQYIQSVPTEGRNVPDLLSVQPGVLYLGRQVNQDTDSRTGAVAGARSDQGNVVLDGIDNNDQVNGYAFTGVLRSTQDSTQEFRVTTANSNADSGRSSGAQVSMVTKSGTNSLHGSLYEYYRPPMTAANDWFNKQAQIASGEPNVAGKVLRNTFGGSVGGPVLRDKLFYFFNYEGQRTAENKQITRTVPTAAYRAGNISYEAADGSVQTLNSSQLTTLDAACADNGVCPWGPGPNPNVLSYFSQFPVNNGFNAGDGYNTGSYTFSSPAPATLNTSILKLDYNLSDRHRIWVRGNLQKDVTSGEEQFPGQPASYSIRDNTKGLAGGYTWTVTSNLVNDLRYGYVRQGYGNRGIGNGSYVDFRFLSTTTAETRSSIVNVPVHNIVDNLSWTKGNHTVQVGGNWRMITNNRNTDANSFDSVSSNPYWLNASPPSPADNLGLPDVSDGFANSWLTAYANLVGTVPQITRVYNYNVDKGGQSASLLSQGAFISRSFRTNEFEYYLQDSWHVKSNLTITYGLRHTILQTPYEMNGQQVAPTIDTNAWYKQRQAAAQTGAVYEPLLAFSPNGKINNRPAYWPKQKFNIAPRLSIAYAPDDKTSIRVGAGMYFDHYGQGIVNAFDQQGSFGLSTSLTNPAGNYGPESAPRFTGRQNFPDISAGTAPANPATFPYAPAADAFLITWGIDNHLKTPYSEVFDLSVQRQLPAGFTLETAYVGRLGRHLLQQLDLTQPVDYVDPKGGGDYYTAAAQISKLVDQNGGDANASVPTIPYFENVFPELAQNGMSATQFIYTNEWAPNRYTYGATTALADIDYYCIYTNNVCPNGSRFWQPQFSSLYAFTSGGMSYYNAAQIVVRHPMRNGIQFDFNYTFSKSIDMGSDAERSSAESSNMAFSEILNTWHPERNRAVSDFDTRHLISWNWVYQLPFGRGQKILGSSNRLVNALVGGWQMAGLGRWSSALPFSVFEPGWTTDWEFSSYGVRNSKSGAKVHKHFDSNGSPQVFADAKFINDGVKSADGPIRLPYPGEAGDRNVFRGDGFFEIDSSLAKNWKLWRESTLRFAWEGFNISNSVRFDTNPNTSLGSTLTSGNLGVYSAILTRPRVQQFSLRIDF